MKKRVVSGTAWEDIVGYSRAIRVGNIIEVSGTTAMDGQVLTGKGDMYLQTKFIFTKIEKALQQLGASLEDVVRTRMYVTDISQWEEAGRAHGEVFSNIRPAATMVQVSRLITDELMIEIEVTAMVNQE